MSVQNVSVGSMFGWIMDSFRLLKRGFGTLLGASALTLLLGILVFVPVFVMMIGGVAGAMQPGGAALAPGALPAMDMTLVYSMYCLAIVVSLLVFPPLLVGWFRLCRNLDQGAAVSAFDIFKPYKDRALWMRSIRFALLAFFVYVVVLGVFVAAFWGVISGFMQQVAAQQAATLAGQAAVAPDFSLGLVAAYLAFVFIGSLLQLMYMVGFVEVSLRDTPVVGAMGLAGSGLLKNLLKLIVFVVCAFVLLIIVMVVFGMVLGLLLAALTLVSPMVAMLAMMLLYVPALLCMYPLMFAGHYYAWKGMLGDSPTEPDAYGAAVSA